MDKKDKALVGEFLARMKVSVGQHDCGIGNAECMADDDREWELFEKLKGLVGPYYGIPAEDK